MTDGKIAFFLHDLRGGGVERVSVNLINTLAERGRPVEVILVADCGPFRACIARDVAVHILACQRMSRSIRALARQLDASRPAAVVSAMTHANVVCLLAHRLARHKPCVVVVEHNHFSKNALRKRGTRATFAYRLAPWVYGWADCVGAVSQGVKEDLVRALRLPGLRIQVLNNPVVSAALLEDGAGEAPHTWFAAGAPPVVLGVGRLHEQKNFPLLIRAFARVRAQRPLRLMILGAGSLEPELRGAAAATGFSDDILFPGFVEPFAFMYHAALFVLSSNWEGLPSALLEAMACGIPVVATDCPSGPREILRNGRLGRLVPVGDEEAMARAITATLDRPPDTAELRRRAADFSYSAAADQYIQLIDDILAHKHSAPFRGTEFFSSLGGWRLSSVRKV
jgi:glycosyltransferase involved in cell wall biosynthesis